MNADVKTKWIAALRSGTYPQGRGHLRTNEGGYCCLGVLCDILAPEDWIEAQPDNGGQHWEHRGSRCYLPNTIMQEAGIPMYRPGSTPLTEGELAELNDRGSCFEEIAQWIEVNL